MASTGINNGPCPNGLSWAAPIWTCPLTPGELAVTGVAVQAAADVLYALTGRHLGACQLTIRPCRGDCWGMDWPYFSNWWQWGSIYPRPVFFSGVWYNLTCNNCFDGCSCNIVSTAYMPTPVSSIDAVKVDGVTLDPSLYRLDDYRKLIRLNGQWPICNNLNLDDTQVGTWSVTLTTGVQIDTMGQLALGELATQFAKLIACSKDCAISKPVQQLVRQGVTMNFLDPNQIFANGRIGLYLCDLFISKENPNQLQEAPSVFDLDGPKYYTIAGSP